MVKKLILVSYLTENIYNIISIVIQKILIRYSTFFILSLKSSVCFIFTVYLDLD